MKHIVLNILLLFALIANAQDHKRTAIWYFGENAGINFNTDPPTALTDGKVNTIEGCASICDTNGNLLFYTDGRTVWNKNHDTMMNGYGLLGHESSTQAALIVPKPQNDSIYYVFTTSPDFAVNVVNINLRNGLGEVISKNKVLITPIGEKQTAVKHQNGIDYWVITHGAYNDEYYAFLVTKNGIVDCPVVSKIGTDFSQYSWFINQGSMKASIQGDKIATCLFNARRVELTLFNNVSGFFTNLKQINTINNFIYGVEFSPNGEILYITERDNSLVQYDISVLDNNIIQNSRKKIIQFAPNDIQKLQIGLNNKIYLASVGKQQIGVINQPNLVDTFCDFKIDGVDLSPKKSLYGLPDFVSSFFYQPSIDFSYTHDCRTNTLTFKGYDTLNATIFKWYFVKGTKKDSFTHKNPTYVFTDTGNHTITFIASNSSITDTVSKTLFIHPKYSLNLGNDTVICSIPFTLNAGAGQHCYIWQDSSSNPTYQVNQSGSYHVKVVSQNHCTQFDTIVVTIAAPPSKPIITRNNDTLISSLAKTYQWYKNNTLINGATQQKLKVVQNAYYQVEVGDSNKCKALSDSFNFIYLGVPYIQQQQFKIYPNSAKDHLYITKPKEIAHYKAQLLDIQGKMLLAEQLSENTEEIPLINIAEGIYVLKISFADHKTETHKLIIQY